MTRLERDRKAVLDIDSFGLAEMPKWTLTARERRFDGPGPDGRDVEFGVNRYLRGPNREEHKIAIWYTRGVNALSDWPPGHVAKLYLDMDQPPEHVLVTSSGPTPI
jgi:hypothetical protein